ncbi:secreted protein [Streptomyces viridochromogenes DSM 40736]|uniref:Secreted protein n=1 Tax=Streptomyces viridochromogenes (strain DSM 40736 / JCM 4977 / BCRC 1201 / Tue 494) TaxID=591159 RepID=D9XFU3_STRVT|nr:C40 family peptidase [Streptomyces viridochromogenes]EFL34824.1 secreted protein [Streptomyces viridochromogenes DSM 40736]
MSGKLGRLALACIAATAAGAALAPVPATALPEPSPGPGPAPDTASVAVAPDRASVARLLTDLQEVYREAEKATEAYNTTEDRLKKQRAETDRLDRALARARLSLHDSRRAAGRLARQQYQGSTNLSPYVRLLLARDPQRAIDQGHVIGRLAQERADTVGRLTGDEYEAHDLARTARTALDEQLALTERRKRERDEVHARLRDVEELLTSLNRDQLIALAEFERNGIRKAQEEVMASGALSGVRTPTAGGGRALRYAVRQIGKPYAWGAEGPTSYDCSGLTSQAWADAGTPVPRTSQEQWKQLQRIPLTDLRPGDLVVYFPEATHVALYLGNGMVVQAPRPGATVKVSPIAANPVLGAVRPDPDGKPLRRFEPPELPEGATDGSDEGYAAGGGYAAPAPDTSAR